ncbi:hypothetical protein Vadar_001916 [Vaccinium darrowii]|uniref:Uncharacterized protein n=1 Tax=Vaccinium darrowii TaxID=229202 RepID=A0ACB7YJ53_9ERIC|nr:hypothetical protein Vadar_001916 [Vaccinium darrowii]
MDKKKGLKERSGCQEEGSSRKPRKVKNSFSSRSFAYSARMAKVLFRVEQNNQRLRNFALSPLSIDVVLHMLADGLQRNALEQILNFLGSENVDEFLSECRDMMTVLEDLILHKGGNELCMVNGVWIDEGCSLPTERKLRDMDMDEPRESNYIEEVL